MSDYEDLCNDMGLDPSSGDDYEILLEMITEGRRPGCHSVRDDIDDEVEKLCFKKFQDASDWSKRNNGKPFMRSADGTHFVPKESISVTSKNIISRQVQIIFKKKHYPEDNPVASTWIPGTYPTTKNEEELSSIDTENRHRNFIPRLNKLSPDISKRASKNFYLTALGNTMFLPFHQQQSRSELFQLISLLEEAFMRSQRRHATREDIFLKNFEEKIKRDDMEPYWSKMPDFEYMHRRRIPKDVYFWEFCINIVMDELISRE
jgi:hypothetical protein